MTSSCQMPRGTFDALLAHALSHTNYSDNKSKCIQLTGPESQYQIMLCEDDALVCPNHSNAERAFELARIGVQVVATMLSKPELKPTSDAFLAAMTFKLQLPQTQELDLEAVQRVKPDTEVTLPEAHMLLPPEHGQKIPWLVWHTPTNNTFVIKRNGYIELMSSPEALNDDTSVARKELLELLRAIKHPGIAPMVPSPLSLASQAAGSSASDLPDIATLRLTPPPLEVKSPSQCSPHQQPPAAPQAAQAAQASTN